jgi:hypothetical protein
MAHCTFPALSRDPLDMAQDRDPGSRPGKQQDGFRPMQAGKKRFAADPIHALLTINYFFSIFFVFQYVSYVHNVCTHPPLATLPFQTLYRRRPGLSAG